MVIPVGLGGRMGYVYSTEMEDCDTPLLISLASQESLGAVLHLSEMRMELKTLEVDVVLLKVGGHLAVRVDDWCGSLGHVPGGPSGNMIEISEVREPTTISANQDSKFYLVQALRETECEESDHDGDDLAQVQQAYASTDRGVKADDDTGILAKQVRKKLDARWSQIRGEDRRVRTELSRPRFEAERFATAEYQTTVIFEPFGGDHVFTRCGAKEYEHEHEHVRIWAPSRVLRVRRRSARVSEN